MLILMLLMPVALEFRRLMGEYIDALDAAMKLGSLRGTSYLLKTIINTTII